MNKIYCNTIQVQYAMLDISIQHVFIGTILLGICCNVLSIYKSGKLTCAAIARISPHCMRTARTYMTFRRLSRRADVIKNAYLFCQFRGTLVPIISR